MLGTIRRVGKYEIVDTIGRGGMAVVYRARQPALNRTAALKQLDLQTHDPTVRQRFIRESRIAAALEHPNIVTVLDFFEDDGVPYIAMEYLPRGSLRPWVGRLTEPQIFGVLEGILAALAHAQEHSLAHRDLKPENVLLTRRGGIKIADFGIAKAYSNATAKLTATGMAVGTPTYMAPEQAQASDVGPCTDLYAVGVMAFELFTGRPPFEGSRDAVSLLYRHVNEAPPDLAVTAPDLDPAIARWVASLLAKDPDDRPANATAAWQTLEERVVALGGPYWRRAAPIAPAAVSNGTLPDDLPALGIQRDTGDAVTTAPKAAPDAPAGTAGAPPMHRPSRFLIHGPDATLDVRDDGHGATLRHVTRWRRPRARRRRQRLNPLPRRFENHVDRKHEIGTLGRALGNARAVNVYGAQAIGKTHVIVEALHGPAAAVRRHGVVYLDGRGQSADDLLHRLYEEFFACRTPIRDPLIARHLGTRAAVVAVEDIALGADELRRLVDGAPQCRFVLTSRERVLWDGPAIRLEGLAPVHAPLLAQQELGHALGDDDRAAAVSIAEALDGHPLRLRQAFSQAGTQGAPLAALTEELAQPPVLQDRLASLSPSEARVARALAVYGGMSVAGEHLRALVDEPELEPALTRLRERHDVASDDGRHRLLGVLAHALPLCDDLSAESSASAAHFTAYLQSEATDVDAALADMPAVLALIERAFLEDRPAEAIRLGRAAEGYLSTRQRWAAWGMVLAIVLACARELDDGATESWALNQLGARSIGLGRTSEGLRLLEQARETALQARDEAGAALVGRNLRMIQRTPPLLPRASHSPATLVGVVVLAIVGLVAAMVQLGAGIPAQEDAISAAPARVTLTVAGSGAGTVHGDVKGVTCGRARCTLDLHAGTLVTLTADPGKGSRFEGWTGVDCGAKLQCRLRATDGQTVVARFAQRTVRATLGVDVDGHGTVRVAGHRCASACRFTLPPDDRVELTARAAEDWRFAGWGGDCRGASAGCSLRAGEGSDVIARFIPAPVPAVAAAEAELTVAAAGRGVGTVDVSDRTDDCAQGCRFPLGTTVELRAGYDARTTGVRWRGATCSGPVCRVQLQRDTTVTAEFIPPFSLTVGSEGPGGVEQCGGRARCVLPVLAGARVSLTATPDRDAVHERWRGCAERPGERCTVLMTRDRTVTAAFHPARVRLVALAEGKGNLTVDGRSCARGCTFRYGDRATLSARHDDHAATRLRWRGADCAKARCGIVLEGDRTVTARFVPRRHTLTIRTEGAGNVDRCGAAAGCTLSFEHGARIALNAAAAEGWSLRSWKGCDDAGATNCMVSLERDRTVTARFARPAWVTATATGDGAGSVTVDGRSCADGCRYWQGDRIVLVADHAPDATTLRWHGVPCAARTCQLVVTEDLVVTAEFSIRRYALTLRAEGDGRIDRCGAESACVLTFPAGSDVDLNAVAGGSSELREWTGCAADGAACAVHMDRDRTVTARFVEPVQLTVRTTGRGRGDVTVDGRSCASGCRYWPGDVVTLRARYDAAAVALTWRGIDCRESVCRLRLTGSRDVTAVFSVRRYALRVVEDGDGTVTCDGGRCEATYPFGRAVTLEAAPGGSAQFNGWTGCTPGDTQTSCTVVIRNDTTVTGHFVSTVDLTTRIAGDDSGSVTVEGRSCSGGCAFPAGTRVTLEADYDPDRVTVEWSVPMCAGATCTIVLDQDTTIVATFTEPPIRLNVQAIGPGGTSACGPGACTIERSAGSTVVITAHPNSGAQFDGWDGCDRVAGPTCTVDLTAARTVTARFSAVPPPPPPPPPTGGGIDLVAGEG